MSAPIPLEKRSKAVLKSVNPATERVVGEIPLLSIEQVKEKVAQAEKAFLRWKKLPISTRCAYLRKASAYILDHMDEIAETISAEMGKPKVEALSADIFTVVDLIAYYTKNAKKWLSDKKLPLHLMGPFKFKQSKIVFEPLGVIAVISPWNFPFAIPMSGIISALIAGNTVVFKPASDVMLVGKKIDEIFQKGAKLPEGVFQFLPASSSTIEKTLFQPPIKKVVLTGSTEVGKRVMELCGKHLIPVVLELGGKDPMLVLEDADLDLAAKGAVWGAFTNCGQVCASIERVYVHESLYDHFVQKVVEEVKKIRIGSFEEEPEMGPMVNDRQRQLVIEQIEDAVRAGAKIASGGKKLNRKGFFIEPTVLVDVNHTMKVMREETFGPVLPIMKYKTLKEGISLCNDTNFGLTASVWTKNLKRGEQVARRIEAGTVCVNDHAYTYGLTDTPWQGMKESGVGRSHGIYGLMEFVFPKHINVDHFPEGMQRRPWWYPYPAGAYDFFKYLMQALYGKKGVKKFAAFRHLTRRLLDPDFRAALRGKS